MWSNEESACECPMCCMMQVLLGWFGFVGGAGPLEVVVSGNEIRRCRTASIRYDGNPNGTDGFLTVSDNRISRAGEFLQQLPPPGSQKPSPNDGNGIVVVGIRDVTVRGNVINDGNGSGIVVQGRNIEVSGNRVAQQAQYALPHVAAISAIGVADAVVVVDNSMAGFGVGISISCPADGLMVSRNTIEVVAGGGAGISVGGGGSVSELVIESNLLRKGAIMDVGNGVDPKTAIVRGNTFFGGRGGVACLNISASEALLVDEGNTCAGPRL
eukprot:COSAG06_NODE_7967_length_2318_cov_1.778279_1_plen_270_part_00